MATIPEKNTTTIYVSTSGETAEECFDVITHFHDAETLDKGVHFTGHMGGYSVAIVDTDKAGQYINDLDRAPGCSVAGHESH